MNCGTSANVGSFPLGNGRYGQADLSGNAYEYVLDTSPLLTGDTCVDCLLFNSLNNDRGVLGGGWDGSAAGLSTDFISTDTPTSRDQSDGFRCARSP